MGTVHSSLLEDYLVNRLDEPKSCKYNAGNMAKRGRKGDTTAASRSSSGKTTLERQFFILYYPDHLDIEPDDVVTITNELKENIKTEKGNLRIDLVIHSDGGDIYSAFKIIKTIRDYCSELYGLIPLKAVSAASLISLGTNKIYMSSQSQLGPLDLPTEHPTMGGSQISSIDVVKSIAYVEGVLKSVAMNRYFELRRGVGLGKKSAAAMAYNIAVNFLQPLTKKLDPIQTSKSSRDLEIAKIYGKELLTDYMFKNIKIGAEKSAEKAISDLVYDYPAHGFAICYNEAKKIGLEVEEASKYPEWERVWKLINKLRKSKKKHLWHLTEKQFRSWTR